MALKHAQIVVGTTPVALFAIPANFNNRLKGSFSFQNNGSSTVYLGDASVSTSNFGYKLVAGDAFALDLGPNDTLYAVVASGTSPINMIQITG